jgi:hypothetical protein
MVAKINVQNSAAGGLGFLTSIREVRKKKIIPTILLILSKMNSLYHAVHIGVKMVSHFLCSAMLLLVLMPGVLSPPSVCLLQKIV